MRENLDIYNDNDSDDEVYTRSRNHRARNLKHLARMERRSALSLRPIRMKSYVDTYSPNPYNSDSDGDKLEVRRSTRNRKSNHSWMENEHKASYSGEYSEEDSRDIESHNTTTRRNGIEPTRRNTRHLDNSMNTRREIKQNTKYMFDFETEHTSRRKGHESDRGKRQHRSSGDQGYKENKEAESSVRLNERPRRQKVEKENDQAISDKDEKIRVTRKGAEDKSKEETGNDKAEQDIEEQQKELQESDKGNEKNERDSSDSEEEMPRLRRRPPRSNRLIAKRTRNRKSSESSSCSDRRMSKGYSLRDRPPKVPVQTHISSHSRRRFTRRRKPSTSSNSETDSDDRVHKSKYNKNAKNQSSKNEQMMKLGAGNKPMPIGPETIDAKVRFSSVGGLDGHIQSLREMILFPMLYPEVFKKFNVEPPRGVLFYGPPGTGKTLIARALANECSFESRKVSFFMRKGADLLSKWIGESEKQLRLLFEQAQEMKPSIIFFDEIDGLAPVRSSRQDQVHASIVSTLLALMDGLDNRGEVIVIGATNRIDAIDPALRRPGRFDRELFFPLPSRKEREEILKVHVTQWDAKPNDHLVSYLAEHAIGYCGSDLRALCSEAVIQSFRRNYPQVYNSDYRLLVDPDIVKVDKVDFLRAKSLLVPASHRVGNCLGRKLLPILNPLLSISLKNALNILEKTFPHGLSPHLAKVKLAAGFRPAQLLLVGNGPEHGQTTHLAPSLLFAMEHIHGHLLDLATLYKEAGRTPEETCIQVFLEVKRNIPSVLYIPSIDRWWYLVTETLRAIFLAQLQEFDPNSPILVLATSDTDYNSLPEQVKYVFSHYRNEVFEITMPDSESRKEFFKPLIIDASLKSSRPPRLRPRTPPPLPRAPTPPPTPMTEEAAKKLFEHEERTLRELRIFLRDMCKKLANNKLFFMFTKPVDIEEVPDYTTIVKQPMDLETMMTKVDFHRYECAKEFLDDIELIVQNALEYNPTRTSADKEIRHRACCLRDYAFTLIKKEMDSDFEEKCQDIAKKRKERKASITQYLPPYIQTMQTIDMPQLTQELHSAEEAHEEQESAKGNEVSQEVSIQKVSPNKKRKIPAWQKGYIGRKKRRKTGHTVDEQEEDKISSEDEFKENNPQACSPEKEALGISSSTANVDDPTKPLTINCDPPPPTLTQAKLDMPSPLRSPSSKRRLSDLLSPSELLEDPLEIDDIDQALNEIAVEDPIEKSQIKGIRDELEKVLEYAVKITANHHLQSLLDLHYQISRIIKQYLRIHNRKNLPGDLRKELTRFQKTYNSSNSTER